MVFVEEKEWKSLYFSWVPLREYIVDEQNNNFSCCNCPTLFLANPNISQVLNQHDKITIKKIEKSLIKCSIGEIVK